MSKFFLLPLFLLIACSNEPQETPDSVGETKRYEPIMITFEDNERLAAICTALSSKEDLLSVLISTGTEYTFSYSQKDCDDKELSFPKDVVATIQKPDSNYIFKTKNGEAFGFTDVEIASKGAMASICANLGNLMSPVQTSSTGAMWFTSFTSNEHCTADANGICVHIQRGSLADTDTYKIHTNEWIKFKIANDKRGFFTERKLISSANCKGSNAIIRKAVLK